MTTCRYCGTEFVHRNLSRHEAICPRNPEVFERLRAFMHEWSENGIGLPAVQYAMFVQGHRLPWLSAINRAYGTYGDFVRACGLEHRPYHKGDHPRPEDMPGSIMADDEDIWPTSVLRGQPVRVPVRVWDVRAKVWRTVAVQEAWRVR